MKIIYLIKNINFLLSQIKAMAQTKNNKTAPRARLAHKLAKYVRANPIHLKSRLSQQNPSTTHLSNFMFYRSSRWCSKKKIQKQRQHLVLS